MIPLASLTNTQKAIGAAVVGGLLLSLTCCCPLSAWVAWDYKAKADKKRQEDEAVAAFAKIFGNGIDKNKVKEEVKFLLPGQPTLIEGVSFELIRGIRGPVKYNTRSVIGNKTIAQTTPKNYLQIQFRITNTTENSIVDYHPWHSDLIAESVKFKDNFNNTYSGWHSFNVVESEAVSPTSRIKPGGAIVDTVAFEIPLESATDFKIELSAQNFGKNGIVAYSVPRSFFLSK